ncbi:MAG: transporter substrate-binding domain-containing protein [Desulfobacterales bacterium]|nr:transporter substrate-binding domain-containing protein [Desulfobacterales bacterium]
MCEKLMQPDACKTIIVITIITIAAVCVTGWADALASNQESLLTREEQAWLHANDGRVRFAPSPTYPPISFRDSQGEFRGLTMDIIKLIESRIGIRFELVACDTWSEIIEKARAKEIDVVGNIQPNEAREKFLLFTEPYVTIPNVIITRKEIKRSLTPEAMQGMRVAIVKGYATAEYFQKHFSQIDIELVKDNASGLQAVSFGRIDAMVTDLAVASHTIESLGIGNLKVAGNVPEFTWHLSFASRKDMPVLNRILSKGLKTISKDEKQEIRRRWIVLERPVSIWKDFRFYASLSAVILFSAILAFLWTRTLRTQVKNRTEELAQSELKYRILAENLSDVIWTRDMNFTLTYISPSTFQQSGFTVDEKFKLSLEDYLTPDSIVKINQTFKEEMAIEQQMGSDPKRSRTLEVEMQHKNGTLFPVEMTVSFLRDNKGKAVGIIGVNRDITIRKRTEEELLHSESKFRNIFNFLDVMIMMNGLEEDGFRFLEVNTAACSMLKFTREEMLQKTPMDIDENLITGRVSVADMPRHGDPPLFTETVLRRKDGSKFPVELSAVGIEYEGRPGILAAVRDITDRKQNEEEKLEAQRSALQHEKYALVGQIAGKMAHDFNNILAGILGNAQLELFEGVEKQREETLNLIVDLAMRGSNLTKNLIAFAKDQEPKFEYFSINDKMEFVLSILKKELIEINIIRKYNSAVSNLLADPGMIEHALVNVIQNAVHATSNTRDPNITLKTDQLKDHIIIEVEDNGCGMPQDLTDRIFEPAFTLKGIKDVTGSYKPGIKGTGYGMTNVKKYIEQHKGQVAVESQIDKGTRVAIRLPIIKKELTKKEIIEIKATKSYSGKQILLVEDEQAISNVQYQILTHQSINHKVDIAANGKLAIDLFNRYQYDLVSLDYILPGQTNGMDVYKHIRKTNRTMPILFVSGNIEFIESIKELKKKDPIIDHISKPCPNKEYINRINRLLDAQEA